MLQISVYDDNPTGAAQLAPPLPTGPPSSLGGRSLAPRQHAGQYREDAHAQPAEAAVGDVVPSRRDPVTKCYKKMSSITMLKTLFK